MFREQDHNPDHYAQQKSLFGDEPAAPHPKGFREELHAREKDNIPNPNRHPGQFAPKGGSNPLLKVVEHEHGWTASSVLKDGKEFRVEGRDRREAIGNAVRAGEKMGVIFDPPKAEPAIGGLFGGSFDEKAHPRHKAGDSDGGQFAAKNEVASSESKSQLTADAIHNWDSQYIQKQFSEHFTDDQKAEIKTAFRNHHQKGHDAQKLADTLNSNFKSQPDPKAIAQEALSNSENIGITMGRHGVTIKGHPDYRTIRQQVSEHLAELQEQAKPQPSAARQRAMDSQRSRSAITDEESIHRMAPGAKKRLESERTANDQGLDRLAESNQFNQNFIKIAADDITKLRRQDVDRVLRSVPPERQGLLESWIIKRRPDLAEEVNTISHEMDLEKYPDSGDEDKYSRVYQQFEHETERYLRDYTLYDVDRYGVGGNIMKMILSMVAMHAMSSMMGSGTSSPRKPAAQKQAPSNQDFEKLHPRAQTQAGNSKPGQFAKKPEGAAPAPTQRQARPLTERPDLKASPRQAPPQQQQPAKANPGYIQQAQDAIAQQAAKPRTGVFADNAPEAPEAPPEVPPVEAKPWLAEPGTPTPENTEYNNDPRRGTPEQKAAPDQQRMARDQAAAQPPVQQPKDANTARIAEIWDVDTTQPEAPRNYPDNLNKPPEQQQDYAPPAHSLEGFTAQVMNNLKTPANEQDNPRKKFLLNGTPNPGYAPQDISGPERPAKIRKRAVKPAAEPTAEPEPSAPSLLDMPAQSGDGDIFENPAAKARKEKAELDRITKFDTSDFAEQEQPEAAGRTLNINDTDGDYVALEEARKQRSKQVDSFRDWEKKTQEDPEANTMEVAAEYELDPDSFSKHAQEMQSHEEGEWERREKVKRDIRKIWKVNSRKLGDLENRKGGDSSNLAGSDELKGSLDDDQVYEFLGSDESMWAQNAFDMVREETPARPGAHDKDWLRKHAEHFAGMSSQLQPQEDYPEPEDGMPFSRRALVKSVDRYFRDARQSFRSRRSQKDSGFWTLLDAYL
jgi:hypothetical protein